MIKIVSEESCNHIENEYEDIISYVVEGGERIRLNDCIISFDDMEHIVRTARRLMEKEYWDKWNTNNKNAV